MLQSLYQNAKMRVSTPLVFTKNEYQIRNQRGRKPQETVKANKFLPLKTELFRHQTKIYQKLPSVTMVTKVLATTEFIMVTASYHLG